MSLASGTRLGPYEVTSRIGAGGMGEVYHAIDTNLKRAVAIKVLPELVASDVERLARFQREAEVLAALNHPNIAAIYGLERSATIPATIALVMELVDGPTLADRIAQGPIPVDEALPMAKQIAAALESAHEQNIIHRDLKPANIKLRPDGTVKVLDFGLAKAMEQTGTGPSSISMSPTISSPAMTQAGIILGTAAYMSPEQAKGRAVDKRSDVWAFGAVLYEMLTGRRVFTGEEVTETLAAVLMKEPDWSALPTAVPPSVVTVLRRCLQKDPKQRMRDIGDVSLALDGVLTNPASEPSVVVPAPTRPSRVRMLVTIGVSALVGALVAVAILWLGPQRTAAPAGAVRLSIVTPPNRPVAVVGFPSRALAISSDGTQVVFMGRNMDARGQIQLQLRSLDAVSVRDLPGTAGARQPFFSPDGQWVGFFTASEIKKVSLAGGNPITVAENINGANVSFGVWTEDNTIVFGTLTTGLRRVSVDGGPVSDLTKLDASQGESYHTLPALVPSTRAVVFNVRYRDPAKNRIDAVMLDSGQRSVVLENARTPLVLESGHILFQRDEALLTAPFDVTQLKVTGPLVPLVDDVRRDSPVSPLSIAELAVSRNGTLAYLPAVDADSALGIVSREGVFEALGPPPNKFNLPRVSPNGHAVAFLVYRGQGSEAHVYDMDRGSMTKVTQEGRDEGVAWRDDQSIAVSSRRKEASGIFLRSLDGTERLLTPFPPDVTLLRNADWSPDGKYLAYTLQTGLLHGIWLLTMGEKPTTEPLLQSSAFSEHSPAFSPNGQWLAYVSAESGREEVWVQRFPKGERLPVSTGGGTGPVWKRDGTELFFQSATADEPQLMAVTLSPAGESLRLGKPTALFNLRVADRNGVIGQYYTSGNTGVTYDVLPDGRFVMVRGADPAGSREIVLVQNWFESLKHLAPAK